MPVIINEVEVTSIAPEPLAPAAEPQAAPGPDISRSLGAWQRALAVRADRLRAD
ncbi:hypothetical protein [Nocardioides sp.]|uniref:hypothetical protein n=1 Tax=Nocardioides sp. TaxID=35761 RepID=UPI002C19A501|nr:hypothetical protein [Nocardioides sp.]HXH78133.1 hypothetical protein [Nocardioides sp.]